MTPDRADIFSWLIEDHATKPFNAQDELNLVGDAYLIAVAGRSVVHSGSLFSLLTTASDTTAAALTCLFYELAINQDNVLRLQKEIDPLFADTGSVDSASLAKLPFLNATINETLRLHPPVPSGVQRMTPPQGANIGATFIPGNSIVQIPTYTIFRGA